MGRPDLLHFRASLNAKPRGLSQALTFGFARGVDEKRLLSLAQPPQSKSTFKRDAFENDLFLDELVSTSFAVSSGGRSRSGDPSYFKKLLVSPPEDLRDLHFRQAILTELTASPSRLELVQKSYRSLLEFRESLCGSDHSSHKSVGVKRRLDILIALRRGVDDLLLATSSSTSGLARIATWMEEIQDLSSYRELEKLLSFEDGRSVLDARLQVGSDGALRRFEIVGVKVAQHPAFPSTAFGRFVRRLVSLLRGYRFSEEDVMSQMLDHVFSGLEDVVCDLLSLSLQLEFYLRGIGFFERALDQELAICLPQVVAKTNKTRPRILRGLFNPWLVNEGVKVVPCDFVQSDVPTTTILTGPNSGGKTRLLQSLAITQLLGQVGLFVPAREAMIPQVEQLYLSLIEHVRPDQGEGRLGLELLRVRQVFEGSGPSSLILMDELCSGTNPSEGERIFQLVLELFDELGPQVLISTHFLDFAQGLQERRGSSLAFLQVEMEGRDRPTYQFVEGVATTSLAWNTAARLGVTREELMGLVRSHQK